jgi:hypothetical protein
MSAGAMRSTNWEALVQAQRSPVEAEPSFLPAGYPWGNGSESSHHILYIVRHFGVDWTCGRTAEARGITLAEAKAHD